MSFSRILIVILTIEKIMLKHLFFFLFFFSWVAKTFIQNALSHVNERNVGRHRERERENSSRDIELRKISFVLIVKRKISGH